MGREKREIGAKILRWNQASDRGGHGSGGIGGVLVAKVDFGVGRQERQRGAERGREERRREKGEI